MRIVYVATLLLFINFSSTAQSFIHGPYLNKSIGMVLQFAGATSLHHLDQLQAGLYLLSIVDRKPGRMVQTSKIIKI